MKEWAPNSIPREHMAPGAPWQTRSPPGSWDLLMEGQEGRHELPLSSQRRAWEPEVCGSLTNWLLLKLLSSSRSPAPAEEHTQSFHLHSHHPHPVTWNTWGNHQGVIFKYSFKFCPMLAAMSGLSKGSNVCNPLLLGSVISPLKKAHEWKAYFFLLFNHSFPRLSPPLLFKKEFLDPTDYQPLALALDPENSMVEKMNL